MSEPTDHTTAEGVALDEATETRVQAAEVRRRQKLVRRIPPDGREVNFALIESLKDRDHPLANIKAETPDLPLGVGEVLMEARISHHLLDLAGVPNENRESHYSTDLDARVWLLLDTVITLRERVDRVRAWHSRETGEAGTVGDFCNECGARWPCATRQLLDGWEPGNAA